MYQLTLLSLAYGLTLPFGFVMPNGFDALIMIISGLGNAGAQFWWTRAIHLAPASAVVPFQYLQLVWAILLGFAIWGDIPTIGLLVGSAIVIASGHVLCSGASRAACRWKSRTHDPEKWEPVFG